MTDKGEKPNHDFVSDQAWDSVNELVNIHNPAVQGVGPGGSFSAGINPPRCVCMTKDKKP